MTLLTILKSLSPSLSLSPSPSPSPSLQVQISEALDGRVIVRDLSLHDAPNELVALDLLMKVKKNISLSNIGNTL